MYNIVPLILILISLSIIIVISVRKFSVLSNLDVDNIPAEKEARFKERIISNRIKRNTVKWWSKFSRLVAPLFVWLGDFLKDYYYKLHELKKEYQPEVKLSTDEKESLIGKTLADVEELYRQEDYEAAEKSLIDIISQDPTNLKAFKKLADIYLEENNFEEAKQTYEHILKLLETKDLVADEIEKDRQTAQIYFNLAEVESEQARYDQAITYAKQALKIEPNNPRYLDTMLEISIIKKDKIQALDAYEKLRKSNPENEKLDILREQIDEL
jgi:tetratricopeptide (TPR) repeat protein